MKTHGILRALLVTTSFSTAVCAMDAMNYAATRDFDRMNPDRSFGKELCTNISTNVKEGATKDIQEFRVLASKAWNGDWASVAGVGVHQLIDHLNGQFLRRYNIPTNLDSDDFNVESLRPFLTAFTEKSTLLLQGWLGKNGTSYAFNTNTGDHYPIFSNTPFNQFAQFLIPDFMPMKSLFIAICDASLINNYLQKKLEELAINCLLEVYKTKTRKTLKDGIALDILRSLKSGAATIKDMITADPENHKSLPNLAVEIEPYSPIVDYLQPRLNHLARKAFNSLFKDVSQSVSRLIIDQGTKAALGNPYVTNFVTGVTFATAGLGGTAGWSCGGLAGGFVGGVAGSYIGGGIGLATGAGMGYKLADTLGGEAWGPFGAGIGGVIGTPLGFTIGSLEGAAIGAWSGSAIGTMFGSGVSYMFVPRLTTHIANGVAQTINQELDDQLTLLVDYHTYVLLPLTEVEHVLYHLNPEPTPEERAIYHQDYARRDQLLSQTFAGEVIKQFIDLKKFINLEGMFKVLGKIDDQYTSFMSYCFSSKDATVKEFWESSGLSADAPINEVKDEKSDKIWREYVLRTTGQIPLTPQNQTLKQNLEKFPSFKGKQQHLNQLRLYMNSLSATNLKSFAENFNGIKETAKGEKERIQKIHQTIEKAGERIAGIYQKAKGSILNPDSIKIIEQSANALWDTATSTQLDRLVEALERADFISKKFEENGEVVIDKDYLKNTLAQYIANRNNIYLQEGDNQSRFEILKKSSLTERLENADIVDLLRKIDQVKPENLPEKIKELLERGDQKRDVISEVKQRELALIKDKYESLLGQQLVTHFTRAFQAQFEEAIKERAALILQPQVLLSDQQLVEQIQNNLSKIESFKQFMEEVTNHASYTLFRDATFAQMNRQIVTIARKSSNKQAALEDGFTDLGSEKDHQLSPETLRITQLKLYDQYDVGGFNLIKIINETFKGNKLDALSDSDFKIIYEKIHEEKKRSLTANEDLEFLENYQDEIMAYKLSQKPLENKLFPDYQQ